MYSLRCFGRSWPYDFKWRSNPGTKCHKRNETAGSRKRCHYRWRIFAGYCEPLGAVCDSHEKLANSSDVLGLFGTGWTKTNNLYITATYTYIPRSSKVCKIPAVSELYDIFPKLHFWDLLAFFYVLWFFIHFNEFIRSYQIPLQHHTTSILQISQIHPFWLTASPSPLQLPWHTLPNMCTPFFRPAVKIVKATFSRSQRLGHDLGRYMVVELSTILGEKDRIQHQGCGFFQPPSYSFLLWT